ncbi:DUF4055 domain-containing protein [Solimicrobium silvestre]|uniref:DUF4055 domain-containing protein n=1 Tax=Solimicrobium silvestre TaxID=2099400 RepID=A0A2S9GY60_9BURK|nr:DUF4055 domain-containing protein [Solimicrobium silvestre]PRC92665.1 hypothetical protein S2091_2720 [Solimicrobium silvestre]
MLKVNEPSDAITAMQPDWAKVDALVGGTKAMRAAGKAYLPQWPSEKDASYEYRLKTSTLFNAFSHTVENMAGKPFSEPIAFDKVDETIQTWFDNIDLAGRNLHVFANEVLKSGLKYGLTHILVDYQRTEGVQTLADEKAMGARPYVIHIPPGAILGWMSDVVHGVEMLTQVRILENVTVPDGSFGTKLIQQVRVLEVGKWATFRKGTDGEWAKFDSGAVMQKAGVPLNFIPLVTYYGKRTGFMTADLPLGDLADLNIKHWQSTSDQDSILHTARVPILAVFGDDRDEDNSKPVVIGAGSIFNLPLGADAKFVEHTGAAIGAGRQSLQDLEAQMRLIGAELLIDATGDVSATQAALDTAQQQSKLSAMVQNLEDTLDQVTDIMSAWAGITNDGDITIFKDFAKASVTGQTEIMLTNATTLNLISPETWFSEMKRRGVIDPDALWADEQERLSLHAPMLPNIPPAVVPPVPAVIPPENVEA